MSQGDCTSYGQDFEQVVRIPASQEAFGLDAALRGVLLAQEVEGDVAQYAEIVRPVPHPHAALILAEGDVEDPMQAVFDSPMVADRAGKGAHVAGETAQVVA